MYSHLLESTEVLGTQRQNFLHIYWMILEFRIYEKSFDQLPLKNPIFGVNLSTLFRNRLMSAFRRHRSEKSFENRFFFQLPNIFATKSKKTKY